jgi:hypothetical protein
MDHHLHLFFMPYRISWKGYLDCVCVIFSSYFLYLGADSSALPFPPRSCSLDHGPTTSFQIKQQLDDAGVVNVLDNVENQRHPFTLLVHSLGLLPQG